MGWIGIALIVVIVGYLGFQAVVCSTAVTKAEVQLESYDVRSVNLSYGEMSYIDQGSGDVVLSVHGICGGYDQALDIAAGCFADKRIIAPSRFGYPGSDTPDDPSPRQQAKAFAELLDSLGIEQAYVLGTSAGGTSAIRFALDFPERTKGLILFSSAPPMAEKPAEYLEYQGPPAFLCNNFGMWLISPLFGMTMGLEQESIHEMLPFDDRKSGIKIDATISNPDMARNFDQYVIEDLQVKTIILHAKDDKLASFSDMQKSADRFPDCQFVVFASGGHKISGHANEITEALKSFTEG